MQRSALIGATGFVGSNLVRQHSFGDHFNSTNIGEICGRSYDLVVCSGIQAKKWWANQNPDEDRAGIDNLLRHLETITATHFVLISTVDVYPEPANVEETSPINPNENHAYGRHRFYAETFVREKFPNTLIMRLPGLFGCGIKKNVIHDLLRNHEVDKIDPDGVFQYYCLDCLWGDIDKALGLGLKLLNVSAEPIASREIVNTFFPESSVGKPSGRRAGYDMRSIHWGAWQPTSPGYLYDKATVLGQLANFISKQKTGPF